MTEPLRERPPETVLVTGASGYLGGAVAARLVTDGFDVRTLQRRASGVDGATDVPGDLGDPAGRAGAVAGAGAVVHLAAKVSLAGDARDFATVNVDGTRALLADAAAAGVSRFVFVSSPSVAHTGTAIQGEDAAPADPDRARGDYARSKAAAELLALAANRPGFAVVAVRPHLVWGPGDPQLVARIQHRAGRGRLPLLGSGAALVDTTYIDDAVSGIVAALARATDVGGEAFVLTSGEPRPIGELLGAICAAGGVAPPTRHLPAWIARAAGSAVEAVWRVTPGADEPPMTRFLAEQLSTAHWFDQRRTRDRLGWRPEVGVTEGLRRLARANPNGPAVAQPGEDLAE